MGNRRFGSGIHQPLAVGVAVASLYLGCSSPGPTAGAPHDGGLSDTNLPDSTITPDSAMKGSDSAADGSQGADGGQGADSDDGASSVACDGRSLGTLTLPASGLSGPAPGSGHLSNKPSCAPGANGPEDVYSVNFPLATGLFVRAATSGGAPVVRLLDSCASTSDVACSALDPAHAAAASLRAATPAGTYSLAVGQTLPPASSSPVPYTLDASTFTIAPNAECATPTALVPTMGMTIPGGDTTTGLHMDAVCGHASDAGHLYYSLNILDPNDEWTITVQPAGSWTAYLEIIDTCTSTSCLQTSSSATPGGPATISLSSADAGGASAILSVRSSDGENTGPFTIKVASTCAVSGTIANCSSCGDNCAVGNSAIHVQSFGSCVTPDGGLPACGDPIVCVPGYMDCNGKASDGCETSLSSPKTCGSCNNSCSTPPNTGGQCENVDDAGFTCTCDPADGILIDADGGGDPFGDIQDCLSASTQTLPWCFSNGEDGFCNQAESSGSQWACCIGWEADSHCESVGPGRMDCCHDDPITGDYCCQFNSTTAADGGVNPPCE